MFDCALPDERSSRVRSKITNDFRKSPAGVDGRSERGRRWRDLLEAAVAEFGVALPDKLRELTALRLALEATQDSVVNGDVLRSEDLVRLGNLISRRERELRLAQQRQRQAEQPVGLRDKLSSRYAGGGGSGAP